MSTAVQAYLVGRIQAAAPENVAHWEQIESLYSKRLWHQLSLKLEEFVQTSAFANGGLVELYESFIRDFEDRINSLVLIRILLAVITQMPTAQDGIAFLERVKTKVSKDALASMCLTSSLAEMHLKLNDLAKAKELLDECRVVVDREETVSQLHASYYKVSAEYFKVKGQFKEFYVDALRYLGCVDLKQLPDDDKVVRAFDLCLAALLGENIFNLGELLAHPILDSLRGTVKEWLVDLVAAFNAGDVRKFEALRPQWQSQTDLSSGESALREKVSLLALMDMVFRAPAHQRSLSFESIASHIMLPASEVEWLLMKALSLDLVKGSIDQVASKADLNWVQPRVLAPSQISGMRVRLEQWLGTVESCAKMMETRAPELFIE